MSANNTTNEEQVEDVDTSSVENFIKELEEKEKDLDISSDLVIEFDDSDVEHDNIHDSFVAPFSPPKVETEEEPPASVPEPKPKVSESKGVSQEQFDQVSEERDTLKEALERRKRDFDSYRKRTERERSEAFSKLVINVATEMLPVLDNLNRALDSFSAAEGDDTAKDFQTFLEGIVLVNQQLNEVLASMGVQPILAAGEPFDPNFHEAVATEETDEVPPKTVISEVLRGYKVDKRVIRASLVKVSSPPVPDSSSNSTE